MRPAGGPDPEPGLSTFEVPVAGGDMHVAKWGTEHCSVLGIHGITASPVSLAPVARLLGPEISTCAPDLRGRGRSAHLGAPYGMRAHAEDCAAVIRSCANGPVVVLGVSMGAYVAVVLAASRPDLVDRLVLADGGLPIPLPAGLPDDLTPDQVTELVLGPALARLQMVFGSLDEYFDFWRAHPAFSEDWNEDVEAYLEYDLEPVEGGFRSRVKEEAVRVDATEQLVDPEIITDSVERIECPISLLRAPRNLLNQPTPLIPDEVARDWEQRLPNLSSELVEDVNHYSLVLGDRGTRTVADRVRVGGRR